MDRSLRHAEGEAAGVLRNSSITRGLLDINNRYVCAHCILALRRLVPTGKELTVRFSTPGGRNVSLRFRNGERPQILRNNQWQDMLGTPQEIEVFLLALDSVGGAGH
ncbi:MAG: hypothetical protein GY717_20980 [Rhodobacteraceae bacterium]|nr:hypothetical protein [Paracoccaceae bacterium]